MTPALRTQLAEKFRNATGRPVRWADDGLRGDFEGRETTLEIFDVQEDDQENLFLELGELRQEARRLVGERLRLLFHTPEATTRHYPAVRSERARVVLRLVSSGPRRPSGVVDEDISGDPRPPRSGVG